MKNLSKPKPITEPFVQSQIIEHLKLKGWGKNLVEKGLNEHGVDIKVKNDKFGRYWLIETKGDPSESVKSPYGSRISSFHSAIGQILTRMHTEGKSNYKYRYKYGIGLPITYKEMALRKMPHDVCNKLNLYFFFVDHKGEVQVYDYKAIKNNKESK